MENPIKMDDLGVPLFLETPLLEKKHHPTRRAFQKSVFPPFFNDRVCDLLHL